tara:strand:+ start:60956 stop:62887 length:1932 start_codon:yes stop_codon:yes gene_type:complete
VAEQAGLKARDRQFGAVRVGLFFAAIAFWLLGYFSQAVPWATWIGSAILVAFLVVVVANEPLRDKLDELGRQLGVVKRLIARLERDWDQLATKKLTSILASVELPPHQRDVADDLDLLGRASLFHLISMAATVPGVQTLAGWLTEPADAKVALDRRRAIETLAPMREKRLRFYTLARQVGDSSGDPQSFVQWAGEKPWLASRGWLTTWANLSAVIAVVALLAVVGIVAGFLPATMLKSAGAVLGALVAINLLLTAAVLGPAHQIFSIAMSNRQAVSRYQELFSSAQWLDESDGADQDGCLSRIRKAVLADDRPGPDRCAKVGMEALQRVASAGALRQSAGTFLLYLPLQAFGLWDVRVLKRLESWQAEYGKDVARWFQALGELESLMSLAALRDEYPQWSSPTWILDASADHPVPVDQPIVSGKAIVKGTSIGHPLLADDARVLNDVSVGPPGTLLLVTGSNMSGKSTMLRSIGLNIALAGTGAPVCAAAFELPSIEMGTSIRVSDNLSEGVSFYMAELHRLKSVVDQARRLATEKDRVLLFLLDEILQGTNSRERQIAVVQVLRHLMDSGSIGAISTHDLELADEPELMSISTPVHFRETIVPGVDGNDQMTFDYRMRQGVSPTTNALKLLEIVGLGEAKSD